VAGRSARHSHALISQENYGRAKETHAHTQALWEKEIRRVRKETFKSQSVIVKLQEELKSARSTLKDSETSVEREKERTKAREQEAFAARYGLVGLQEQLEQALERVKLAEQERDAFKTLAKSEEEIARMAAEGRLPLPPSGLGPDGDDDEFASPGKNPRVSSLIVADVKSSAASEAEIEELTRLWQWEKHRADRAREYVDFLQAECHLRCCPCARDHRVLAATAERRKRPDPPEVSDAGDLVILGGKAPASPSPAVKASPSPKKSKTERLKEEQESKRSTIFIPAEGLFRTVSREEAEALGAAVVSDPPADDPISEPPTPVDQNPNPPSCARTPSVDPPAFALLGQERTSLLSLLDAPQQRPGARPPVLNIPTVTPRPATSNSDDVEAAELPEPADGGRPGRAEGDATAQAKPAEPLRPEAAQASRPHTAAAFYSVKTTTVVTTKVPLRDENTDPGLAKRLLALQRTPSGGKGRAGQEPSFDITNPALTPTMTREQALAQIRERRGRARSVAQALATPRKQMMEGVGVERRDVSAPAGRVGTAGRVRS
jgi:hypothetical protein